jgi:outer membrane receptor protein involved in Fe transport
MMKIQGAASRARRHSALVSVSAIAVMLATPAYAQDEVQTDQIADEAASDADSSDAIIVTGSRIRRPNLESSVPVVSIGGDEFFQQGRTAIGDVLNDLPSLRSTIGQSNSTRFLGTAGLNLLDLRGLGTQRTLVLQNGRRHVGSDLLSNAVSVDTNQIPTDLIERVDIVTGGSSAIYGSDAIAGVVNFVLKRDFEGLQIRGQSGISQHGDAGQYYVSGVWGTNFAEGRGNVAVNVEYARQEDWYASQRKSYRTQNTWVQVDSDPSGLTNGSDGVPDSVFTRDVRSGLYSNGGTFLGCCDASGNYLQPYLFRPDGTLTPQTGEFIGVQSYPTVVGGDGNNFRDGTQTGFSPRLDRVSVNLIGHFTVSDAFEPFIEAKYVRTNSLGNASGPFFFSGGTTGSPREVFNTDNPYLNPQARQFLLDYYGSATDVPFYFQKNVVDLGNREEKAQRETFRIVGGVRGTFNDDWNYEVSGNYGEFRESTRILGNLNVQRFLLAIDAVDQGLFQNGVANGNIVCRAQVDPTAAIAFEGARLPGYAAAQLANDVAACKPANMFGEGNISQDAKNYMIQDTVSHGKITQLVLSGFLSGDTSQWFELPGGPVGFAIGAEYRRETNDYTQDPLVDAGLTFYNAIPTFNPPAFEVKEIYGELRVPILANMPFFHELTLTGAGRIADYKGKTGTVYTYNGGVEWSPIEDIRFRAQYARSVRAPNLTELYTPAGQNFAPGFQDPCDVNNIGDAPNRAANCAAAGIPNGTAIPYLQSLPYLSGGNPDLDAEKSDSYTIGGVFQPRFLPGFSASVDYYNITVNNVIVPLDAQTIVDACYDSESTVNSFCGLFTRNGNGTGPSQEAPYQILSNSLLSGPVNFAKLKVRGIDVEAAYRKNFGSFALNTRIQYTHVLQNDNFLDPLFPTVADRVRYELGDPADAFNWNVEVKRGKVTFGYQMRYIGKMTPGAVENIQSVQGRPPENEDAFEIRYYPDVFYHDLRLQVDVNEKFNAYFGVDNVGNRLPPYGLTGIGGGSGIYNNIGRFFYVGAVAKF